MRSIRLFSQVKFTSHNLFRPVINLNRFYSEGSGKLSVQEVEDRVMELLRNFSKTNQDKLTIDAHFSNDLGLDSLDQVEVTMELEDEFNVELPDAVADKIFTVRDAVEACRTDMIKQFKRGLFIIGKTPFKDTPIFNQIIAEFPKKTPENYFGTFKSWTITEINERVFRLLLDSVPVPQDKVSLEAHLSKDLLMHRQERFGFQDELQQIFQFRIPFQRFHSRDLHSGQEASLWVASILEEFGRLKV